MINFEGGVNKIQHIQWILVEIAEKQSKEEVWSKVISWVEKGQLPEKAETRGKAREVLIAHSIFDPAVFKMKGGVLMFTKAAKGNQIGYVSQYLWLGKCGVSVIRVIWEDIEDRKEC